MDDPYMGRARVLHIDDDPALVDMAGVFIERNSSMIHVDTEIDPEAAIEYIQGADPQFECVVTDYLMAGTDGFDILEAAKRHDPNIGVIFYTMKDSESVAREALSGGADGYVQKSGGKAQYAILANQIEGVIKRKRAERNAENHVIAESIAREGICIYNKHGNVSQANQAYCDLYGYTHDEIVGQNWRTFHPDEEVKRGEEEIIPQIMEDGAWSGTGIGLRKCGETFHESKSHRLLPSGGVAVVVIDHENFPLGEGLEEVEQVPNQA